MKKIYHSESGKVQDMPNVMKYIIGRVADIGAGQNKITHDCIAFDGRALDGINVVADGLYIYDQQPFDTIFSSHFLEHVINPSDYVLNWWMNLNVGGYLILYLPSKEHYDSHENKEHMFNWSYEDFMFWFKRGFTGEGMNYKGEHLPKMFEVVESGMDVGEDRYSFFVIARKV